MGKNKNSDKNLDGGSGFPIVNLIAAFVVITLGFSLAPIIIGSFSPAANVSGVSLPDVVPEQNSQVVDYQKPSDNNSTLYLQSEGNSNGVYRILNMRNDINYVFLDINGNEQPVTIGETYPAGNGDNYTIVYYYSYINDSGNPNDGMQSLDDNFAAMGTMVSMMPWLIGIMIAIGIIGSMFSMFNNVRDDDSLYDDSEEEDDEEENGEEEDDEEEYEEDEEEEEKSTRKKTESVMRDSSLISTEDGHQDGKKSSKKKREVVEESPEKKEEKRRLVDEYMQKYSLEKDDRKTAEDFDSNDKFINNDKFS